MSAFFGDRSLHQKHQESENDTDHGKDQEAVKIRKSQSLLITQVPQRLQGHLLRAHWITRLLKVARLGLCQAGGYGGVRGIKILAQTQRVTLITTFCRLQAG